MKTWGASTSTIIGFKFIVVLLYRFLTKAKETILPCSLPITEGRRKRFILFWKGFVRKCMQLRWKTLLADFSSELLNAAIPTHPRTHRFVVYFSVVFDSIIFLSLLLKFVDHHSMTVSMNRKKVYAWSLIRTRISFPRKLSMFLSVNLNHITATMSLVDNYKQNKEFYLIIQIIHPEVTINFLMWYSFFINFQKTLSKRMSYTKSQGLFT